MRRAFLFGVVLALALPKQVECGYPGAPDCTSEGQWAGICKAYEVEPFAFYLLELALERDIGFAYSRGADCR